MCVLCGHYKGVDHRVRDHLVTREISIGDFVLSGGELAAAVFCDSIIRLIPGVLGDESSALNDSFQDKLLAPEIYTRPSNYKNWNVPNELLSNAIIAIPIVAIIIAIQTLIEIFSFKNKKPSNAVINGIAAKHSKVIAAVVLVIDQINVIIAVPRPIPPMTPDIPIFK